MDAAGLVAAAIDLAAAFDRGGRLLAVGEGRGVADARHVAVEFLHPVNVGKRALPAAVGADRVGPDDIVVAIAYGGAAISGRVDIALADQPVSGARHLIELPSDQPFAAKEAALAAYHVLWELVHLFLEDGPTGGAGSGDLDALYPMLSSGPSSRQAMIAAAVESTEQKLAETTVLRAQSLAENDAEIDVAAALLAAAPTVFTFGNGGSASARSSASLALPPLPNVKTVGAAASSAAATSSSASFLSLIHI